MSYKVEDHYDLRKHLHVDYNMIFYEERKSSCDECHSKLKTTTTWENTCTLTITWFFMKSEKVHVLNAIQSWRSLRLEKNIFKLTITWFLLFIKSEKFLSWMSFTVQDHYNMKNIFRLTVTWFFMKREKVHVMNVIQSWRPLRLEKTLARWP